MQGKFHFLLLLLFKHKKSHSSVFIFASFLVALISSVLFLSSSIEHEIQKNLFYEADISMTKFVGGQVRNTPKAWIDESLNIKGMKNTYSRVYGKYFYESKSTHFFIVGIDFFDVQNIKYIEDLIPEFNQEDFLDKNHMIIGSGVKEFFDDLRYTKSYIFRPPDRGKQKVFIYASFPKDTRIVSNDIIIMDIDLAKKILGISKDEVTDIVLELNNPEELQTVYNKLLIKHFDSQIITKQDLQIYTQNIFNYKSGVFLSLYLVVIASFSLLLYQRYSYVNKIDKKEIAVLRLLGWNVSELLWLKLFENGVVALWAYLFGVLFAFFYVFYLDAPLLQKIFLGDDNLNNAATFTPFIDFSSLALLFFFFITPFLLSILIPLWRVCVTPTSETLR